MIVTGRIQGAGGWTPGATITEVGTYNATPSDFNGYFSINVSSANSILEITFIGLKTVRIKASDVNPNQPIFLQSESQMIEEITIDRTVKKKTNWIPWVLGGSLLSLLLFATPAENPKKVTIK